ncbi:MAG: prepilin-type N-terminal cleavage/methylation domain-containing protein [Phycisphaerales bacterium]|nr:prepilin-type N-terminal cleavage/methylation domain-containing protein [Phycisphaerales bacterium]
MRSDRRGFTLVESLLVVVLVGLLTALLLPVLAHARASVRDVMSVANMRTHAQVLAAYAVDWDDYYPALADPDATWSIIRGGGQIQTCRYFESVLFWNIGLCDQYYDGVVDHESFRHPAAHPDANAPLDVSYLLSSAFLASPAYWEEKTRIGPSQWGPSRLSSVVFASDKAAIVEVHPDRGLPTIVVKRGIGVAFVDGSGGRFDADDLVKPYLHGDGTWWGTWLPVGVYGMHTVEGWSGRDRH